MPGRCVPPPRPARIADRAVGGDRRDEARARLLVPVAGGWSAGESLLRVGNQAGRVAHSATEAQRAGGTAPPRASSSAPATRAAASSARGSLAASGSRSSSLSVACAPGMAPAAICASMSCRPYSTRADPPAARERRVSSAGNRRTDRGRRHAGCAGHAQRARAATGCRQ